MTLLPLKDHPEHLNTIAQWYFDQWLCHVPNMTLEKTKERLKVHLFSTDPLPQSWLAMEHGELIAVAELKEKEDPDFAHLGPWLCGLYVHKPHRGRQLGPSLVEWICEQARQLGKKGLYLQCLSKHQPFYQSLGFETLCFSAKGHPIMSRSLIND